MRRICKSNGKKIKMKILQYYKCYGLKETLKKAVESIKFYLDNGIEKTQNKFN